MLGRIFVLKTFWNQSSKMPWKQSESAFKTKKKRPERVGPEKCPENTVNSTSIFPGSALIESWYILVLFDILCWGIFLPWKRSEINASKIPWKQSERSFFKTTKRYFPGIVLKRCFPVAFLLKNFTKVWAHLWHSKDAYFPVADQTLKISSKNRWRHVWKTTTVWKGERDFVRCWAQKSGQLIHWKL